MLRVGLTGGIASGKSHVLRGLAAAGFHTLDLDAVAHEVMAPGGAAHASVVKAFGPGVLTPSGTIDREALGAIVFSDSNARGRLNAIVHPLVRQVEARQAALHAEEPGAVLVTDAALLVESGVHLRFDRLVVVHCAPDRQLSRLQQRGLDDAPARARISAQMPAEEKRRFAHFEVDTSGSFDDTDRAVARLVAELRVVAEGTRPPAPLEVERALGCLVQGPARGPRGLDPARLVSEIAAAGGVEMERLAALLVPRPDGPWYRAARAGEPGTGPESLAGPLVIWALARSGPDPPFLLAAAASVARLTHREPAAISGACLLALALQEVAVSGRISSALVERRPEWSAWAERWTGERPPPRIVAVLEAVAGCPLDVAAARRSCLERGGDPDLTGALLGLTMRVGRADAPPPLAQAVGELSRAIGL